MRESSHRSPGSIRVRLTPISIALPKRYSDIAHCGGRGQFRSSGHTPLIHATRHKIDLTRLKRTNFDNIPTLHKHFEYI